MFCERVKRARPLLGTLVEVSLAGTNSDELHHAASAALDEIALIHELMSSHVVGNDVHRVNTAQPGAVVNVSEHTYQVLEVALGISQSSGGVFDITVGSAMVARGALPALADAPSDPHASFRDIELVARAGVRLRRKLLIDLGGIAKGYAVDRAVDVLLSLGVGRGSVNAGGDIRAFGDEPVTVHVRDPLKPAAVRAQITLRNAAFATSANYSEDAGFDAAGIVLDPRQGDLVPSGRSASVRASSCMVADALTKCALLMGHDCAHLLHEYAADGFVCEANRSYIVSADKDEGVVSEASSMHESVSTTSRQSEQREFI